MQITVLTQSRNGNADHDPDAASSSFIFLKS
jgi:hypothetical protein